MKGSGLSQPVRSSLRCGDGGAGGVAGLQGCRVAELQGRLRSDTVVESDHGGGNFTPRKQMSRRGKRIITRTFFPARLKRVSHSRILDSDFWILPFS